MSSHKPVEFARTEITLPEFDNPPVIEVALSVQFESLQKLKGPQVGLLWGRFRSRFPNLEEHPPLPHVVEVFGTQNIEQNVKFELLDLLPPQRTWFLTERGEQLIQVQQDRFVHNWRKRTDEDEYPRYDQLVTEFRQELREFKEFLAQEGIGDLDFTQCEVTYVNQISVEDWPIHQQLERVIAPWSGNLSDAFLPIPEDSRLAIRYVIPSSDASTETPLGRLHVTANPAFRISDRKPMIVLTLTARLKSDGSGLEGVARALDSGHEWVVRGFASITTPYMHQIWGRRK